MDRTKSKLSSSPSGRGIEGRTGSSKIPAKQRVTELKVTKIRLRCRRCRDEKSYELYSDQLKRLQSVGYLKLKCAYCTTRRSWEAIDRSEIESSSGKLVNATKKILLVGLESKSLAQMQVICQAWDSHVDVAQKAIDGLGKLAVESYDLLVSELHLSDMSADAFLKSIQDNLFLAPQQVVFLGKERPAEVREFVAANGCRYFRKPPRLSALLREVERRFPMTAAKRPKKPPLIL